MATDLAAHESALVGTLQLTRFAGPASLEDEGLRRRCYQITGGQGEGYVQLTLADVEWLRQQFDEHEPLDGEAEQWEASKLRLQLRRTEKRLELAEKDVQEFSARYAVLFPLLNRALQLEYGPEEWRQELCGAMAVQTELVEQVAALEALLTEGQTIVRGMTGGDAGLRDWLERAQLALRDPWGYARRFRIHELPNDPHHVKISTLRGEYVATVSRSQLNEKLLELMEVP